MTSLKGLDLPEDTIVIFCGEEYYLKSIDKYYANLYSFHKDSKTAVGWFGVPVDKVYLK